MIKGQKKSPLSNDDDFWMTKAILDKSKTPFFRLSPTGQVEYSNKAACESLGYSKDELEGLYPWDFDPDFKAEYWPEVWERLQKHEIIHINSRHQRKDGTCFDVEVTGHFISTDKEKFSFTFVQDVTERKVIEAELRMTAAIFNSQIGMVVTDKDGGILKINEAFTQVTGYGSEDAVGRNMSLLSSGMQQPEFYDGMWASIVNKGSWQGEIWNRRKNGEAYPQWLTVTAIKDDKGQLNNYVGTMMDITQRKILEEELQRLAHYDALTDLPNRALLMERLNAGIASTKRNQSSLCLMYIDLDRFKEVNDNFGHSVGDLLLTEVAIRLRTCFKRGTDTIARLGGDEFIGVLSNPKNPNEAFEIAQNILKVLSSPYSLKNNLINISASIGIAFFPDHALDADSLIKIADQALYAAKNRGKNQYSTANDYMKFI